MILAIDQGTTGSRAFIFDDQGKVVTSAYSEFEQHFPKPGWVEHDAAEIWDVTKRVCDEALADAGLKGEDLKAIGITNQRETAVAWDKDSGEPLHKAIVWQDRRTAGRCDELKEQGHEQTFRDKTGLVVDAYFSGTKYEWLLKNGGVPDTAAFGTIDSWLLFKLTGQHATDYSNASRTLLYNIKEMKWDEELCEILGVPMSGLPEAKPNIGEFGKTTVFGGEVPVCAMVGDQQAAMYGQACITPGLVKNTYGTGNFLLQMSDEPVVAEGLIGTIAWGSEDKVVYALESSMFVTGSGIQWLRDGLKIIDNAAETQELAESLESNDGVYFVPALQGLGSPHWDSYARGTIIGLTRGTTRAHIARAGLEAIAYQSADAVLAQNEALGTELKEIRCDGGATANPWLMQFQADILNVPVLIPEIADTTALGAAYMAGVAIGMWTEEQVAELWTEKERFEPKMGQEERERLLKDWQRAVERSKGWVDPASESGS